MFLFLLYTLTSFAPASYPKIMVLEDTFKCEKIVKLDNDSYNPLMEAIGWFETQNIDSAYNPKEEAYGRFQIRRSSKRVEHYNLKTGKNYTYEDMFDFQKSREVFLYYAVGKTYEQAAKDWNGSGIMTIIYWMNINNILNGNDLPIIRCDSKEEAKLLMSDSLHVNFDYMGLI